MWLFDPIGCAAACCQLEVEADSNSHQPRRTRLESLRTGRKQNPGLLPRGRSKSSREASVDSAVAALSMSGYGESTQEPYVYGKCGSDDNLFQGLALFSTAELSQLPTRAYVTDTLDQSTPPPDRLKRAMLASRHLHLTLASQVPNPQNLMPLHQPPECLIWVNPSSRVTLAFKQDRLL